MSATAEDRPRLLLEDALGALSDADGRLAPVELRLRQRMRSEVEATDLALVRTARQAIRRAMGHLGQLHPDRRGG